jgi:hypothetical protein
MQPDKLDIQEDLEQYEDLRCLREAKAAEKNAPTIGLAELKRRIRNKKTKISPCRKALT